MPFQADCTLIFPAGQVHQITNTGSETIRLTAWLSESPARVFLPSGERLMLPWDSSDMLTERPLRVLKMAERLAIDG